MCGWYKYIHVISVASECVISIDLRISHLRTQMPQSLVRPLADRHSTCAIFAACMSNGDPSKSHFFLIHAYNITSYKANSNVMGNPVSQLKQGLYFPLACQWQHASPEFFRACQKEKWFGALPSRRVCGRETKDSHTSGKVTSHDANHEGYH